MTDRDIMKRYEFGALASNLLRSGAKGDRPYAMSGALEKQLDQFGLNSLDRKNLMNGFNSDDSNKAKLGLISSCAKTYEEHSGKLTMGEHFVEYDAVLKGYLVDGSTEYVAAKDIFDAVSRETLGNIQEKQRIAKVIVDDADDVGISKNSSKYKDAQKTLEKYDKVMYLYGTLETDKMESIRNDAVKPTIESLLKSIVA